MKEEYDAGAKCNEGKPKYGAKKTPVSTVRNNPQETSYENEDDDEWKM